jgi:outer membrane protein assembly factor BamD
MRFALVIAALAALAVVPGCRHKKYENPISKETQQPDKVLFDTAVNDIEHGRYEQARIMLQTLMNTYDTSEFLAKAKLAVADSWYREGGVHGYAQAEAEYKDFILFYPQMEEAAEAQEKICKMQYDQMDKSDRDPVHARRAEDECRQLLVQFPNSKFAPEAQQYLRNVQEVLGDAEFKVAVFYQKKGSNPAAANRYQGLTDQFPLFSLGDEALMGEADAYQRMGDNYENQQAAAYTKLVREFPLSKYVDEAKSRLKALNRPIPDADPVAYAREKYEIENRQKRSMVSKVWGPFSGHPNLVNAAKSGTPQMTSLHPTIPASVPATAAGSETGTGTGTVTAGGGVSDVTAGVSTDTSAIDKNPDARMSQGGGGQPGAAPTSAPGNATVKAAPANGATGAGTASTAAGASADSPFDATAKANMNLPQNHTGITRKMTVAQQVKQQQKLMAQMKKQQEAQAKQQKRAQEEQAKLDRKKKKKEQPQTPQPAATPPPAAATTTPTQQ